MSEDCVTEAEKGAFANFKTRYTHLRTFFLKTHVPESNTTQEWYSYLAKLREEISNFYNELRLVAVIMAKEYLMAHFEIRQCGSPASVQGSSRLEIDVKTLTGARIIGEVTTTKPDDTNEFSAYQLENFRKQADKLNHQVAKHRFLFVTEAAAFDVLKKPNNQKIFTGIQIVSLPSGKSL